MTAAIRIDGVTKVFNPGSADQVEALREIDLEIRSGGFVSVRIFTSPMRLRR